MKKSLHILVPSPCAVSWDHMTPVDGGKFCGSCNKVVIDFSKLSDTELFNYFKNAPVIPCGRFHNSQLNTAIAPVINKPGKWRRFYRTIAASLAFLSLKNNLQAAGRKETVVINPVRPELNMIDSTAPVIISGIIKDKDGIPLQSVEISYDQLLKASSDEKGFFSFEISTDVKKTGLLTFYSKGLIGEVRSYHAAMQSTSYDVTLFPPGEHESFTGGAPLISIGDFPPLLLCFAPKQKSISKEMELKLDSFAMQMRNNPGVVVSINASDKKDELKAMVQLQKAVKFYLVDKQGISEDRFKILNKKEIKSASRNVLLTTEE